MLKYGHRHRKNTVYQLSNIDLTHKEHSCMKKRMINILKYLLFIIIPFLSVILCVVFKIAQGEKTEEIVFGVMLGILMDFIYSIFLLVMSKTR